MNRLQGKIAIVTGSGSGNGRAITIGYAREGARVFGADVDEDSARETAELAEREGGEVEPGHVDVADSASVQEMVRRAEQRFGGLDIMVANAGILARAEFLDHTEEMFDRIIAVNLRGVFLCGLYAGRRMAGLNGGSIINIASVNGFWVEPGLGAYCAAKGGVITLTRSTAADFGRDAIRCNCICPGYVDTGMAGRYLDSQPDPEKARAEVATQHAVGRVGQPVDVAACAQYLASDAASFVTGAAFVVDGGLSLGVVARP
jgi:meso-butanediol dehydrogenase/(S,S)-butanediol dehydrogenase/diacetyl reductase